MPIECDLTWFCFCFDFVRSGARRGCCSIVCLRFQVEQTKQVDCNMSTKKVNSYTFSGIFRQLHLQVYKATNKQIVRLITYLITYHSCPWIMFSFN